MMKIKLLLKLRLFKQIESLLDSWFSIAKNGNQDFSFKELFTLAGNYFFNSLTNSIVCPIRSAN